MRDFTELHKDIATEAKYSVVKSYRSYSESGRLVEAFEKNEKGEWIDVTEREQAKIRIEEAQEQLNKLKEKENEETV